MIFWVAGSKSKLFNKKVKAELEEKTSSHEPATKKKLIKNCHEIDPY